MTPSRRGSLSRSSVLPTLVLVASASVLLGATGCSDAPDRSLTTPTPTPAPSLQSAGSTGWTEVLAGEQVAPVRSANPVPSAPGVTITDLGDFGGGVAAATAIASDGTVVGASTTADGATHPSAGRTV